MSQYLGGFSTAGNDGSNVAPVDEREFAAALGIPIPTNYTTPQPVAREEQQAIAPRHMTQLELDARAELGLPVDDQVPAHYGPLGRVAVQASYLDFTNGIATINGISGPLLPEDVTRLLQETMRAVGKAWNYAADETLQQAQRSGEAVQKDGDSTK